MASIYPYPTKNVETATPSAPDVRHTIYDFLHADLHMREARAILEHRRQAVVALMAGEHTLRTPEFVVTQDLGLLSVTCVPESAQTGG